MNKVGNPLLKSFDLLYHYNSIDKKLTTKHKREEIFNRLLVRKSIEYNFTIPPNL